MDNSDSQLTLFPGDGINIHAGHVCFGEGSEGGEGYRKELPAATSNYLSVEMIGSSVNKETLPSK